MLFCLSLQHTHISTRWQGHHYPNANIKAVSCAAFSREASHSVINGLGVLPTSVGTAVLPAFSLPGTYECVCLCEVVLKWHSLSQQEKLTMALVLVGILG